jgi:hypothetical protein
MENEEQCRAGNQLKALLLGLAQRPTWPGWPKPVWCARRVPWDVTVSGVPVVARSLPVRHGAADGYSISGQGEAHQAWWWGSGPYHVAGQWRGGSGGDVWWHQRRPVSWVVGNDVGVLLRWRGIGRFPLCGLSGARWTTVAAVSHGGGSIFFEWQRCSAVGIGHTITESRDGGGVRLVVVGQRWRGEMDGARSNFSAKEQEGNKWAWTTRMQREREQGGLVGENLARGLLWVSWRGPAQNEQWYFLFI